MKPDDGYIAYIINPSSGASSSKPISRLFAEFLTQRGFDVRISLTKSMEDACRLSNDAAVDYHCAMVVVAGGDGTVREVAHGLEGSDKPLLIIACGTENLLANELGFDGKIKTLIKTFDAGYIRTLDLGTANGKCFTSIAGFGFDGQIVHTVSSQRVRHIDHFDYVLPIWKTFWAYKFKPMKIKVDGEEIFDGPSLVFVGNISRYAIGLQILHDADPGDGLLDVCVYKCPSHLRLAKHSVMTFLKKHTKQSDVIYRQGKSITVTSEHSDIMTQIDGDPGPKLPVEIKIIPQAVKVMVPENAKPAGMRTRIIRAIG